MIGDECNVVNFRATRAFGVSLNPLIRMEMLLWNMIQVSGQREWPDKQNPTALCSCLWQIDDFTGKEIHSYSYSEALKWLLCMSLLKWNTRYDTANQKLE